MMDENEKSQNGNVSLDSDMSDALRKVAETYGVAKGLLKFYEENWPVAMEQIKSQGCKTCRFFGGQNVCKNCDGVSLWRWNGAAKKDRVVETDENGD